MLNISPVSWKKDEGLISQLWTRLLKDWKDINGMPEDALDKLGLRILWHSACDFSHFIWIHLIWNWNKVYEFNYFYRLLFLLLWCVPSSNFLVLRLWWCFMILGFRDLRAEHSSPPPLLRHSLMKQAVRCNYSRSKPRSRIFPSPLRSRIFPSIQHHCGCETS